MSEGREIDLALMMADLCGYTALTETHGAFVASEIVLRFVGLVKESMAPGVRIVDCIGDEVFCCSDDSQAIVRTALRLREAIEREPDFPRASIGIHRGKIVEREGRLFGAPINLAARLVGRAAGNQILCTEVIAKGLSESAGVESRPVGEHRFKNVTQPVALYELLPSSDRRPETSTDPVCRMQVTDAKVAATLVSAGATYRFCSAECARLFAAAPGLYQLR